MLNYYESPYLYAICIDLEATCWEKTFLNSHSKEFTDKQEIIEFPAVLLNLRTCIVEAEFHTFVRPTEIPTLSKYCTNFTGINQEDVDNGVLLGKAIQKFHNWVNSFYFAKGLVLIDEGTKKQNTVLITWSDFDLGVYLPRECERKSIPKPAYFDMWIDMRELYQMWTGISRRISFRMALKLVGIQFIGRPHSGIDDSLNLARLVSKMKRAGLLLDITSVY